MKQIRNLLGQKIYSGILCLMIFGFGVGILCFPAETAGGAASGLSLCLYTLIPATFPFLVLSSFSVYSGFSGFLGRILNPITKLLFHLPGCCGSVIALGWLGGYPSGARGIASLYQNGNISRHQGERMLWFCVSAGPSFTVSVIGAGFYQSPSFGLLLFLCQTGALLLIGIVTGIWSRIRHKNGCTAAGTDRSSPGIPLTNALVSAANDGARGIINLCCFVMLFTALIEPLNSCGILRWLSGFLQKLGLSAPFSAAVFPLSWEISSGASFGHWLGAPLSCLVFFTAFGGLCVLCQIFAISASLQISKLKFFLSRIVHAALSLLFFLMLKPLFFLPEPTVSVFHNTAQRITQQISSTGNTPLTSAVGGGVLLALCAVFLICSKKNPLEKLR